MSTAALPSSDVDFIQHHLAKKSWRMDNLYKIINKWGDKVTFTRNRAQKKLSGISHKRKLILKSRQHGVSTFYTLMNFDTCLTTPNFSAGIQSYSMPDTFKLAKKVETAWLSLPQEVKELLGIKLNTNNFREIGFSNGSSLRIGNFRGDTLQSLHVSELAKIDKTQPAKSLEIKTGAMQAIHYENPVTVEGTAETPAGLFYEWVTLYRALTESGMALSPMDFYFIFLSWTEDDDCQLDFPVPVSDDLEEYFRHVALTNNIQFTQAQKYWYAGKYQELKFDIYREYPTTPDEAFKVTMEGLYYRDELQNLLEHEGIKVFTIDKNVPVYIAMDLGMDDYFTILFAQIISGKPYIIGEYHNSGKGIDFYCEIMQKTGYTAKEVFGPHDLRVRELGTGRSRIETFRRNGVYPVIIPKLSIIEGIEATRQLLKQCTIHESCKNLVIALSNYRKQYDEKLQVYLDSPVHDIHSHFADALRYLALGLKPYLVEEVSHDKSVRGLPTDGTSDYPITVVDGLAL